jgi:glycosyltransferase involved in cell wall biosynthesis
VNVRIAIVAPHYDRDTRGNGVTVRRIETSLRSTGCSVMVFLPVDLEGEFLPDRVREFAPHCIHGFHALYGGRPARRLAAHLGVPYLVTLTGTDLYGVWNGTDRDELRTVLASAAALTVFHDTVRGRLLRSYPWLEGRITVVPQGVPLPPEVPDEPPAGGSTFFLPAGIRPVKNVLSPLEPLAGLLPRFPELRFLLAGPVLDPAYGTEVQAVLARYPFASWLGEIPHHAMAARYAAAGVVLNTSRSEGGMCNSLLEAMAAGRPVLAADIEGNRSLVIDGVNGLLYGDGEDFREKAALLLADRGVRRRLGRGGREYVAESFPLSREAEGYLRIYARLGEGVGSAVRLG